MVIIYEYLCLELQQNFVNAVVDEMKQTMRRAKRWLPLVLCFFYPWIIPCILIAIAEFSSLIVSLLMTGSKYFM